MRVLITTPALHGHLYPLVPLARALVAAGHDVRVACAPSFAPIVAACGLTPYPAGFDFAGQSWANLFPAFGAMPPGEERRVWAFHHIFVGAWSRAFVPEIQRLAASWRPDVIVRDYNEFGACIAGELLDIPHAVAGVCMLFPTAFWHGAKPGLDRLRADYG
jgi:UDP:flavonoid glycosyltransferase YjiC (YdhE family)